MSRSVLSSAQLILALFSMPLVASGLQGCEDASDPLVTPDPLPDPLPAPDAPGFCEEVARFVVEDLNAVQPETGTAAVDVLDAMTGPFVGSWEGDALLLDITAQDHVEAVQLVLLEAAPYVDDGGPAPGAPDVLCPAYRWEIASTVWLSALPSFDEQAEAVLTATGLDQGGIGFTLSLDDVVGTSRPDWDTTAFDETDLTVSAAFDGVGWTGSIAWSSHSEDPGTGSGMAMVAPSAGFRAQ